MGKDVRRLALRRPEVLLEENPSDAKALEGRASVPRGDSRVSVCTGKVCQDSEPTRLSQRGKRR